MPGKQFVDFDKQLADLVACIHILIQMPALC